jgi:flavin reductase (DIM6/NTAB) family NADH-FMN oxidoreductase RutF
LFELKEMEVKMKKEKLGPCVTFFPQPTTLISTISSEGAVNIMTASWAGIVSKTPPTMAVSLHHGRQSYENIKATGQFVVNMVPASLAVEADYCGIRTGREHDKLDKTGLHTEKASVVKVPLIAESPLSVECQLTLEVPLGDYRLVLAEIVEIHAAEGAIGADGETDVAAFDPLVYLGGIRQYWSLGEKQANAYKDGLLLEK